MHLCFIDESGSAPTSAKSQTRYFVIAGLIIPEAQWHGIAEEFQVLKDNTRYRVRGEIKWRYFGAQNNDPKNTVQHLSQTLRDRFRAELFNIIVRRNSVKIIACVASAPACYKTAYIHNADDLYEYTYKAVTERFQYFLQDIGREGGSRKLGMIIADQRDKKQDERLKRHHQKLLFSTARAISTYENLVEGLFLTESHGSLGIQLADMVAGAIGRGFNSKDRTFLTQIKPAFRRDPNGKIPGYGLVKMPHTGWK